MIGTIAGAVVVLDAAGVIGRGLTAAALDAGAHVLAVDRSPAALSALADLHPRAALTLVAGSAEDEPQAQALAAALRATGRPLAAVLATFDAGKLRGRLLDQTAATTCAALSASIEPGIAAVRHLLPLLAEGGRGGSFVLVGGPGGRHPWAGYGQRSVAEAALRMVARVLHCEARAIGVRLQLLSVDTPTWGLHAGPPRAHWPSALEIGQHAVRLLAPGAPTDAVVEFADLPRMPEAAAADGATHNLQSARRLLDSATHARRQEVPS